MTFREVVCPQRFRQMANNVIDITAFILPTQTQRQVADNAHQQRFPAVIGVKVFASGRGIVRNGALAGS